MASQHLSVEAYDIGADLGHIKILNQSSYCLLWL